MYGLLSLPDSQTTCGGWEANDAVPPPRGVGRDSDIYIRVQRVLLLNLSYLKHLCINHSILLLYANIFTSPLVLITSLLNYFTLSKLSYLKIWCIKHCNRSFYSNIFTTALMYTVFFSEIMYIVTSQHK